MTEHREAKIGEIRSEGGKYEADIQIVTYGVVDSYGTSWKPGVFSRSIAEGSIPAVWAHQSDRPIGVVTNFRDNSTSLSGTLEFLDFDAVPDARMAYEAMKKGAIKGVSFGFSRNEEMDDPNNRGAVLITDADMFEASPVLRASVPGSRVLAVRSDEKISRQAAADLLVKLSTGQIDLTDALVELKTLDPGTGEGGPKGDDNNTEFETPLPEEIPAEKKDNEPPAQPEPTADPDEAAILEQLDSLVRRK